jgi:hypothetical protein
MKRFFFIFVCIATFQLLPCNAWAYIDPGSGSLLLQVVIGGILGTMFTVRTFFKRFFPNKSKRERNVSVPNEKSRIDLHSSAKTKKENSGSCQRELKNNASGQS